MEQQRQMRLLKREYASPHFKWTELQCRCKGRSCGVAEGTKARWIQPEALEKLETLREILNQPLSISSCCRCGIHNAHVGGKPLSFHRSSPTSPSRAFDCRLTMPKDLLIRSAEMAGFLGIGVSYRTFVHVDNRPRRARW